MNPTDVTTLSNETLESEIASLSAQVTAAEHRLLTRVRELDRRERHRQHGLPSMAAWLNWKVGLGPVAAREKVRVAKALGDLPQIDEAFARAEVSYSKVRAMTRIATPESEGRLLHMAREATAAQLDVICRGVQQVTQASPDGQSRWVKAVRCGDGMVRLEARLHGDEAALVLKSIDAAVEEVADASSEAPAKAGRPDGLLRIADAFLAGQRPDGRPGGERHQLVVCIREDAMMPGGASAEAEQTSHLTRETVRRLACDSSMTRVTTDASDTPLDVGRKQRTIPPALRRALLVRDRGCRFPGCTNHRWVDAHHIHHWVDGGPTSLSNLVLLCTTHHRLIHEGGFCMTGTGIAPHFERPDGTPIVWSAPPTPALPLPCAHPPKAPPMLRPDYNLAIGLALPRRLNMRYELSRPLVR